MSQDNPQSSLTAHNEHATERVAGPSLRDYAMLQEVAFIRREAQAEANMAYEDWRGQPSGDRYAVYLAAQDRADAAQDALANTTRYLLTSP